MANKPTKINVKAFNALKVEIAQLYDGIVQLDKQLNGALVKRFYDLARGVNQFVNAFSKLNDLKDVDLSASVKSVEQFFTAIQTLDNQLKLSGNIDSSPVVKFSNALYRLTLSINEIKFDGRKINALVTNLQKIINIPNQAPLGTHFDDYIKSIRSFGKLGDVMTQLESVKAVPLDPSSPLGKFIDGLVNLAMSTRGLTFNDSLLKIVSDVSTLFKAMAASSIDNTNLNVAAMDRAFQQVQNFFKRIVELTAAAGLGTVIKAKSLFPALVSVLDSVFAFLERLARSKLDGGRIDVISNALTRALDDVRNLFVTLVSFSANLSIGGILKFRTVVQPLLDVLGDIADIFLVVGRKTFDVTKLRGIQEVFEAASFLVTMIGKFGLDLTTKLSVFGAIKFGYIVGKFTGIFAEITKLFQVITTGQKTLSLTENGLKAGSQGISAESIAAISRIFFNVNDLFEMLATMKFGNGGQFSASFKGFFTGLGGLTSAVAGFVRFQVFSKVMGSYLKDMANLLSLTKDINPASVASLADIFQALIPILGYMVQTNTAWNAIKGGINKAAGAITLGRSMDTTINAVKSVLFVAKDINPETVKGVGEIFKGLALIFPAYAEFAKTTNEALKGGVLSALAALPVRLLTMFVATQSILSFVRNLVKLTDGISVEKTTAIGEFTKGLGALFAGLSSAFRAVSKETAKVGDLKSLIKYLIGVELLIYPIRRVANSLLGITKGTDASTLTAAGAFVRSVAQALLGVAKAFEQAKYLTPDLGTVIKTLFVFGRIISPIKEVAKIMAALPKGAGFAGGAEYITAVSKFLSKMFKTFTDPAFLKGDNINSGKVKQFIGEIVKILKAINIPANAFKSAADLVTFADKIDKVKNLDQIFEGLAKGIRAFKDIEGADVKVAFGSVGEGILSFAKAVEKLTPEQVDRLERVGLALKNMPTSALNNLGGGAKNLTEIRDLSEDVAQGMQRANLRAAAFSAVMKGIGLVISALDPRRPIQLMVDLFNSASNAVDNFKTKFLEALTNIREFGERIRQLGGDILTNFGIQNLTNSDLFKTTVEFDKLGSSLEVFGGLSKEQRKEAEDFANVLGKDYPLSANEALKATLDLIKAGQDLGSARSILPAAADLASLSDSGSIENATSFIIQANAAFKDFNETTKATYENSAVAVDIIAAAADTSTASVEGLAEGLANVGPVASQFGLSLEEAAAVLAIFTDGGIKGAEAGTQLKSFLTNLTTKEAQKELRKLGVAIQDNTTGQIRPLNDILNDINKAFTKSGQQRIQINNKLSASDQARFDAAQKALATAQRNEFLIGNDLNATGLGKNADKKLAEAQQIAANATAIITELSGSSEQAEYITATIRRTELQNAESLKKIAGSYGQAGLAILLSQGEDGLKDFIAQMQAVEPAAVRAKKALDNINGDMIQLQGSVETLTTKALAPLLEKLFRPLVQVARAFVDALLQVDDGVIEFITTALSLGSILATIIGGVTLIVGGLIQLGGAAAIVATYLGVMTKALTIGLVAGLTGLAAGIATLAAGFVVLTPLLTLATAAFDALSKIFTENLGGATTQLENLANRIGGALGQIGTAFGQVIDFVVLVAGGSGVGGLEDAGESIAGFFNSISLSITKFQTSGAGKILMDFGNILSGITQSLQFDAGSQRAADEAVGAIDNVNMGFAGKSAREAKKARDAYLKNYATFIVGLTKNNKLLESILGENLTFEDVQGFLDRAVGFVEKIRGGIGRVFDSFGLAFTGAQKVMEAGGGLGEALKTFINSLGANLDNSIGGLAAIVLRAFGNLFNLKTGALADVFDTKGFAAGVANLIQKGLAQLKKLLLNNKDGIKGFLTFVFENIFLGALNLGKTIADFLGAGPVADFIGGIVDSLKAVFGGVVDTVFNLIAGQDLQTALLNAFGPGIKPFLDLVDSLGKAVNNIVSFIGLIFKSIFQPPEGAAVSDEPFLLKLFNGIVSGLTGVIDFLNNNILNFLATGDIGGMINNLVSSITTAVQNLDLPTKFADAAASILNGFVSALKSGFLTIGTLLGFDAQGFLDDINAAMKASIEGLGDGATVFEVVVASLQALLVTALNGVFVGIGELLNIDTSGIIEKINTSLGGLAEAVRNVFGGADGSSIFDSISTIIGKLAKAITDLFAVFATPEADTAQTKIDPIRIALSGLVNVLGSIVSSTINTVTDLAEGVDKLLSALALLDPAQLLLFTGAMTVTGIVLGGLAGGGAVLTALGVGLTSLGTAASTAFAPIAAVIFPLVVFVQFLRAIAQNLDTFTEALKRVTEGDFIGAFTKAVEGLIGVFTDLGFNLLEMLGITDIVGLSRTEFHKFGEMVVFVVENAMKRAGGLIKTQLIDPITNFVNLSIPLLLSGLEKARLQVKAGLGDTQAGLIVGIFDNIDALTAPGGIDFRETTEAQLAGLAEDIAKGGQAASDRLKGQVGLNFQSFYDSALTQFLTLPDDPVLKAEFAAKVAGFFDLAGVNDDALAIAAASGDTEFFTAIVQGMLARGITITPEMQKQFADTIIAQFNVLNPEDSSLAQLDMAISTLTSLGLDTTYLEAERAKLQAQVDEFLKTGVPPTTDLPVTVTPDVTVAPGEDPSDPASPNYVGNALFKDAAGVVLPLDVALQPNWVKLDDIDDSDIMPTIQEAAQAAVDKIPAATPLVTFDSSSLTDPTAVQEFNTLIGTLITNITTLGTELNGVAMTTEPVTTALNAISEVVTTFRDITTPLFSEVGVAAATIGTAIRDINASLLALFAITALGFPAMALSAVASMSAIAFSFFLLKTASDTNLQSVVTKVRELAGAFKDASLAASALSNNPAFAAAGGGSSGGGGSVGPGRASGGPVIPGVLYPFLEKRLPELVQLGQKTFLAVPQAGKVTALSSLSSSKSTGLYNSRKVNSVDASGGGSNILVQQGDTHINITGIDPTNARQVADALRREQSSVLNRNNVRLSDKLRNAHR
jgi:TP901 family phage tail tape measure protein